VRWLLVAAVAAFSSLGAYASEPVADEATSIVEASGADAGVTVTPIPMPEPVTQLLEPVNPVAKLRSAKKLKLAKKESFPRTMLSRTERHQMALLLAKPNSADHQPSRKHLHDEHGEAGYDELALHSFFNRPKVASEPADGEDADAFDLSETIKLRLFLARAKAVQAHTLAKVADDLDDKLSEAVKLRLLLARTKAVQAHQKKFS
jgi:hypothetical protein